MRVLSTEEKRALTAKSDSQGLVRLAAVFSLLAIISLCIATKISYWPLLLLPQGLIIISLFHLEHECIHDTPFRTQWINKTVGAVCGLILLLPCEWFRYFHRDHHRYTQVEGKDPELDTKKPETKAQWMLHISGLPMFKALVVLLAQISAGRIDGNYIPDKAKDEVVRQTRLMTIIYALLMLISLVTKNTLLLWIWVVPLQIGQPFLRLYLLAEHTLCDNTDDMFLNTRTVLTNPLVRWFTWNMPYHTEHHVYPGVPFHKLPVLHRKMQQYLKYKNASYTQFNQQLYKTLD